MLKSFDVKNYENSNLDYYWEVLSKIDNTSTYVNILPNGVIYAIGDDKRLAGIYDGSSLYPIMRNISFMAYLNSGYMLIGIGDIDNYEGEVGLFSPCGKLMGIYAFDKQKFSNVVATRNKDGYRHYTTGFSLVNRFFFRYNTLAVRCANKCYLSKAHRFDLSKLFYVGLYDDIASMYDTPEGLVAVNFKNGLVKLYDKNFNELHIVDDLSKVIFLLNGDFFVFAKNGKISLYNKKCKFIKNVSSVDVKMYDRFYVIDGHKIFDCFSHKERFSDFIAFYDKDNYRLYTENSSIACYCYSSPTSCTSYNVLANCPSTPVIVNNKFLTFRDEKNLFVVDPFTPSDNMDYKVYNAINKTPKDEDLSPEKFMYFKSMLEYMHGQKHLLKYLLDRYISNL